MFYKSFPLTVKGSPYPKWVDVTLSDAEEKEVEAKARATNIMLLKECFRDAKEILKDEQMKDFQTNIVQMAIALFEKRSSHTVYWKEEKARKKFEEKYPEGMRE